MSGELARKRKPTPKERVLKRWPKAKAEKFFEFPSGERGWGIFKSLQAAGYIGSGPTPAAAWRNAAERMK